MESVLEYNIGKHHKVGSIEVICGSMFSGKTEELIRRVKRAQIAKQSLQIFKPSIDVRYSETDVVSHDTTAISSTPISSSKSIFSLLKDNVDVIGIDEAQFMDNELTEVCVKLANNGARVIIAGLDMDFKGLPFGPVPALCAVADTVTKVHAICMNCGSPAIFSHRITNEDKRVMLGERQEYEPLCRACYLKTQVI